MALSHTVSLKETVTSSQGEKCTANSLIQIVSQTAVCGSLVLLFSLMSFSKEKSNKFVKMVFKRLSGKYQ